MILWRGLLVLARHEADLIAAEERVQLAITAGDAGTWDLDLRARDNTRSDSYFRLLGYDLDEAHLAPQELWESVVWPDDLPLVRKEWLRSLGYARAVPPGVSRAAGRQIDHVGARRGAFLL